MINFQILLGFLSLLGVLICIPPLVWHLNNKNIPAICLIAWIMIMCLKTFIDDMIWGNLETFSNSFNGNIYCDIMIRLQAAFQVGVISAVLAICRQLYLITSVSTTGLAMVKWKKNLIDLIICFLFPVYTIIVVYWVEKSRYLILRYSGCQFTYFINLKSLLLYAVWQVVVSLVSVVYSCLTLVLYFKKRKDFKDILHCTYSSLSTVQFIRLLIFCFVIIAVTLPLSLYNFISQAKETADYIQLHSGRSVLDDNKFLSNLFWKYILFIDTDRPQVDRWIYFVIAVISFSLFGLGSDAVKMYKNGLCYIGFGSIIQHFDQKRDEKRNKEQDIKHNTHEYQDIEAYMKMAGDLAILAHDDDDIFGAQESNFEIEIESDSKKSEIEVKVQSANSNLTTSTISKFWAEPISDGNNYKDEGQIIVRRSLDTQPRYSNIIGTVANPKRRSKSLSHVLPKYENEDTTRENSGLYEFSYEVRLNSTVDINESANKPLSN